MNALNMQLTECSLHRFDTFSVDADVIYAIATGV